LIDDAGAGAGCYDEKKRGEAFTGGVGLMPASLE
jgi:hypothetical protein